MSDANSDLGLLMLAFTRRSARNGISDGMDVFGIDDMPQFAFTVRDTWVLRTVRKVGLRPAVGFQLIEGI